jgi:hypothetical protein
MLPFPGSPAPHARLLLSQLADPAGCAALDPSAWDLLVRSARSASLLGTLAARVEAAGILGQISEPVSGHLRAALAESLYLRQMSLRQLAVIAETLRPLATPLIVLKGSAYILAGLHCAGGRLPRDVDLMVERHRLDEVERALLASGWRFSKTEEYDQRYYREWSHELPPMRSPALPLELDLHHTILPPIGRLKPDAARLVADSLPVPGTAFRVLRPADQFLHSVVHLFQDSYCVNKLRDLVDVDSLARDFAGQSGEKFWHEVIESAAHHGLGRPLWYALTFSRAWLGTPVAEAVWNEVCRFRPPALPRSLFVSLAAQVLAPVHPDEEAGLVHRSAATALEFRALWLRMPPWLLAYHSASKLLRSTGAKSGGRATPSELPRTARGAPPAQNPLGDDL